MASPLQAVFDRLGGISAVRNRSSGQQSYPPNLGLAFEFGPIKGIEGGRFAFEVKALPNYGFSIVREQCLVRKRDGGRWWFDRIDKWRSNVEGLVPALEPSALALPLVGGDERFAPIFKVLGAMRVYSIEPSKLREMQDPDSGVALRPDGSNAASVLQELFMAVFQKPSPSVLVIEEPEATIHPGAFGAVLDLIRRATKTMQVVVTTHSPELLDARWITDANLRIVTWQEGASHVLPPSQASRKAMRTHLMGAGELLRSNALQADELFANQEGLRNGNLFESLV